jgi:hypothetical protein
MSIWGTSKPWGRFEPPLKIHTPPPPPWWIKIWLKFNSKLG